MREVIETIQQVTLCDLKLVFTIAFVLKLSPEKVAHLIQGLGNPCPEIRDEHFKEILHVPSQLHKWIIVHKKKEITFSLSKS